MVAALNAEVQTALQREVKQPESATEVAVKDTGKEPVKDTGKEPVKDTGKEPVKDTGKELTAQEKAAKEAEAAAKKELDSLNAKVKKELKTLRSLRDSLKEKSRAWSKAGNDAKVKEVDGAAETIDQLRNGMMDTETLLRKKKVSEAKMALSALEGALPPAKKKAEKLIQEKVKSAGGLGKDAQEEIKAFLKTLSCPGGMQRIITKNPEQKSNPKAPPFVAFCIDSYEYPGKGQMPKTDVSWDAANGACAAKGKRLCLNWEWKRACGGKYPYGSKYDPEACNTVDEDGIERPVLAAGSKSKCKARGLYDMVGNVAEWTAEKTVNGGDSYKTAEEATCYRSVKRFGGSNYVGFRCCADPK